MATLTLGTIKSLIRDVLNESSTTMLIDTELTSVINDGYKDVATKALSYEYKITKTNIAAEKIISLKAEDPVVIRVNFVEYKSGTTEGGQGLMEILPQAIGYIPVSGSTPQYWFQWGDMLVIEPVPDAATYDLALYASCYPTPALSSSTDTLDDLPEEFHECVYFFALAYSALKLRRWGDAALAYNQYIATVQRHKAEYIAKHPDTRITHDLPDSVILQEVNRG